MHSSPHHQQRATITTNTTHTNTNISTPQSRPCPPCPRYSRFWRLYVEDNFGGETISVRELKLRGPDDTTLSYDFDLVNDGQWHTYDVPIHEKLQGSLSQIRLHPGIEAPAVTGVTAGGPPPTLGNAFVIDWVRIVIAPTVRRVTGCIDKFYQNENLGSPTAPLQPVPALTNGYLQSISTVYSDIPPAEAMYGTTYNCPRRGGEMITIVGTYLGTEGSTVTIGGVPCLATQHAAPETVMMCAVPPRSAATASAAGGWRDLDVEVRLGDYPQLFTVSPYLSYQTPAPVMHRPTLSNVGARSIDLSWYPPGDIWDHVTVTGYVVEVRSVGGRTAEARRVSLGNVTTTSIIGLIPDTLYSFAVVRGQRCHPPPTSPKRH